MENVTKMRFSVNGCNGEENQFLDFLKKKYPAADIEFQNYDIPEVEIDNKPMAETIWNSPQGFINQEWENCCSS